MKSDADFRFFQQGQLHHTIVPKRVLQQLLNMFPAEASRRFSSPHLTLLVILLQAWEHKVAGDAATVPQGDQLIQLAYADAIQPFLATTLGEKEAVYVCPLSQAGIAAGNWVPDEVTNGQIYTAGDYLLPRDTPVFIPGSGSYTKTLQTYVSCVRAHLETSLMHAASPTYLSYVELVRGDSRNVSVT